MYLWNSQKFLTAVAKPAYKFLYLILYVNVIFQNFPVLLLCTEVPPGINVVVFGLGVNARKFLRNT